MPRFPVYFEQRTAESFPPLVSVIIPAFNAERFLAETLRAVLAQTYRELEVLVVDDGSKDNTVAIAESFAQRDSRVRVLRQRNSGVAVARNLAISQSRGEFIAPVDADDIWYPHKIEKQVKCFLESRTPLGLVYGWSTAISETSRLLGSCANWKIEGHVYPALILRNFIGNASVPLFRRSVLEEIGGYDCNLHAQNAQGCEDWDITLRVAERYAFGLVPEFLVGYRQIRGSMSANVSVMGKSYDLIVEDIKTRHPEIPDDLLRWSQSYFYLYLMSKAYLSSNVRGALPWLSRAMRCDKTLLLAPVVYRVYLMSSLRLLAEPLTTRLWPQREEWLDFRSMLTFQRKRIKTLPQLMRKANQPHWCWKPYDILAQHRMNTVLNAAPANRTVAAEMAH
ncbi:MAG TPA: glycosyltransferase family A protein [Planctomycetota bacterium]|nr:glycosyltransferase family A protein [Planctomycetota bacterium]